MIAFAKAPGLQGDDYLANFNQSPWLIHPARPLSGFDPLYGEVRTALPLRARRGFNLVDALVRKRRPVVLDDLQNLAFDNGAELAVSALPDLLRFCEALTDRLDCAALRGWDGRFEIDSRGALLFREFARLFEKTPAYARRFTPKSPLATPSGLNPASKPEMLRLLAEATTHLAGGACRRMRP